MRLMPIFSLPSISSLTSDLHVKPCLHTSLPPLAPPTPALGQGQKEEFPHKEDKEEEGILGFISACHRDFANPSLLAHRSCRVCLQGRNGKGRGVRDTKRAAIQLYLPPFHVNIGGGRRAPARSPAHRYRSLPHLGPRGTQVLHCKTTTRSQ